MWARNVATYPSRQVRYKLVSKLTPPNNAELPLINARPSVLSEKRFFIARGAGSSNALNRQCGTTGADTRAAFVDNASRHPRHPNTNSLLSNSNPLLSESQSTTIPLPSHYHPLPVRFWPPPDTYVVRTGVFQRYRRSERHRAIIARAPPFFFL